MKDYTTSTPATMSTEELNEARKQNAARIKVLEEQARAIYAEWDKVPNAEKFATPYESRIIRKANEAESEKRQAQKIGAILRNNYRVKRWEELAPIVAEILEKYAGKPYGEKTAEKMRAELYTRARAYFYIDRAYPWAIEVIEARADGCTDPSGERFTIWQNPTPYFLTDDNKINTPRPDVWHVESLKPYTENPAELIKTLDGLKAQAENLAEELKTICKEYNAKAPAGLDELYPRRL